MKFAMTALAVVFLAGATSAAAQPGQRGEREWSGDRPQRDWGGRSAPSAPRAAPAPRAPAAGPAPRAPEPRAPEPPASGYRGRNVVQDRHEGGPGRSDGDHRGGDRHDGDRHDGDRRDWDRGHDGRGWRGDGDRHDGHDRGRDDRGRDWDRGGHDRRDWDRDRRDRDGRSHWTRSRYPSIYFSSHRYHHRWRPPPGYYVHVWSYGDFLPRGWFGPDWWLIDPWTFDLPMPPPGFDWVRVGDDALLVDRYSGRIVQVVRDVFW
jgi:hypothetical protein